ncbi:MAG: conjugative transposon protein TraM [Agriterribacter sp.]
MEKQLTHSTKFLRQRKFSTMLPLLVFPFMTFLLWSIGLIGSTETKAQTTSTKGFNMNLPEPISNKDSTWNKLRFYEQADKDSARYRSLLKNDPYYSPGTLGNRAFRDDSVSETRASLDLHSKKGRVYDPFPKELQQNKDLNEEKVYHKLSQLNAAMNKDDQREKDNLLHDKYLVDANVSVNSTDVDRLENMMKTMQGNDNAANPEMDQINGMLEKILDIQHPDRIKEKLQEQSEKHKGQVFAVSAKTDDNNISLLQSKQNITDRDTLKQIALRLQNGFYALENDARENEASPAAVAAHIPETQILVNGATVRLQLSGDIYINGLHLPKDQFVYGLASLNGERLAIHITSIRYQNTILPVDLSVYDLDGMEGIFVPGAITRDVAKQSSDQAIQSMSLATLDPSLGAQAASAGIQAAKSLIGKKIKLLKVTVKSGYQVLLRDNNQKNQ